VVTGASTGIGWGCVRVLTEKGHHVFGSVRKEADAERLTTEFGKELFTPLLFDVTDERAVRGNAAEVRTKLSGQTLLGLVNNAGAAFAGPLLYQPIDEFRKQLEVNLVGQLVVTQAFAPLLGVDRTLSGKPGRIINMSSVGGKMGAPFLGAYVASKHGLEGMSESLRRELLLYGIDVIIIGPGAVATPIWEKQFAKDYAAYNNTEYAAPLNKFKAYAAGVAKNGVSSEEVGELVAHALTVEHPKVRYPIVRSQFFNWTFPNLLPKRLIDRVIGRRMGLLK